MYKNFPIISVAVLIVIAIIIYLLASNNEGYDLWALQIGNIANWMITMFSYLIIKKAIKSQNPQALLRGKMTGTMIKMFATVILVLVYVFINDRQLPHYSNIFFYMGIFVVYSAIEAMALSQGAKLAK